MRIQPFKLERYFAEYEFKVRFLLSPSDCESLSLAELLAMADPDSRRLWDELRLSYTESQGHPVLRQEIADLYRSIHPEQVLVAAPEEAIFITMHALVEAGDEIVSIAPAYQSLYEIARSLGCQVKPWRVTLAGDRWRLDLDELADLLTPRTRLLVINFPHNPTGLLPSLAEFQQMLSLAESRGALIFSDEMYRGLEYHASDQLPAACDLSERAISLSGLSKTYALPGLRLGWLATRQSGLLPRWLEFKDYTTICHSAPSEILGVIALRKQEEISARSLGILQKNLAIAQAFFSRRRDQFRWIAPQAGSVAFPRWIGEGSLEKLCQVVLEQHEVMIVPGSIFDGPADHFRLGLGRLNFEEALNRLEIYLAETEA